MGLRREWSIPKVIATLAERTRSGEGRQELGLVLAVITSAGAGTNAGISRINIERFNETEKKKDEVITLNPQMRS